MILRYRYKLTQHLLRICMLVYEYIPARKINGNAYNYEDWTNLEWFSACLSIWSVRWVLFISSVWGGAFRYGDSHPECCGRQPWSPSERFCSLSLQSTVVPVGYQAPVLHTAVRCLAEQFLVYLLAVSSRSCSEFCALLSSLNTLTAARAGVGLLSHGGRFV